MKLRNAVGVPYYSTHPFLSVDRPHAEDCPVSDLVPDAGDGDRAPGGGESHPTTARCNTCWV